MTSKPRKPKAQGRSLEQFMASEPRPAGHTRCTTCANQKLAKLVREFVALRDAGKTKPWHSWPWFVGDFLRHEHGIEVKTTTIYNHLRNCLRTGD